MSSESLTSPDTNFELQLLASTLAHEMRNPLQSIRFQIDAASKGYIEGNTFELLREDLNRLERVIQKVQRFSQPVKVEKTDSHLKALIQSSFDGLKYWMKASKIELVEDLSLIDGVIVQVDSQLIEQLILNLATNAIQAMESGGQLSIQASFSGGFIQLEIKDSGAGMDEPTLQKLGTPFFTTKAKGSGLGVAFCRSVAALHGGSLTFKSEKGQGSTATLRIPG